MKTSNASLQSAVRSIKLLFQTQGKQITEVEIAERMNLPYEQFQAYLTNKNAIPQDLIDSILSAYGFKQIVSSSVVQLDIQTPVRLQEDKQDLNE